MSAATPESQTSSSDEIVVLSNDVVPGMGLPVAAPGLRAQGIADGLRALGHRVTLIVDARIVGLAATGRVPPPRPPGVRVMSTKHAGDYARNRRPKAFVMTNSNHIDTIGELPDTVLVYDFFAPKMLELEEQESGEQLEEARRGLTQRKLTALGRAGVVVINGEKKTDYVADWLTRAGRDPATVPTMQVATPLRLAPPREETTGDKLRVVVSGYLQPWSRPGAWLEAVLPRLDAGALELHLMVSNHWGGRGQEMSNPDFEALAQHPGVITHGSLQYEDFTRLVSRCDVALDVFESNPERLLAMVTRTLVSLACGLPAIHVPFTETGLLIDRYDAGWLAAGDDPAGVAVALDEALEPDLLARRRAGARRLAEELLDPQHAVAPLHEWLEALP